jgi:hypothetical protein
MESPLQKLALDYWYQVLMAICAAVFLLAGAGLLKEFPTAATAAISAGGFFIGMGEWINHPRQTVYIEPSILRPGLVGTGHPRRACALGIAFDIAGLALAGFGIYLLVR